MTAVFLDLDGTLMESHIGILSSLRHAFRTIGRDDLAASDLTWIRSFVAGARPSTTTRPAIDAP